MPKKTKSKKGETKRVAATKKGAPRQCSVCQGMGHTARSHQPGGRLS